MWVHKIVGTQNCGFLKSMGSQKFYCVGTQNLKFVLKFEICGYSKFVGTCTQNFNFVGTQICGYSKFVGTQNLLILKICGTKIVGTQNFVSTQKTSSPKGNDRSPESQHVIIKTNSDMNQGMLPCCKFAKNNYLQYQQESCQW